MKTNLLLLILTLSMLACQPTKEIVREVSVGHPPGSTTEAGAPLEGPRSEGVVDSGGGNGLRGRPLESYRSDIRENQHYKEHVFPLLVELAARFPRLASDLFHIARERRWYLIPGSLRAIPSERIGVHFGTDQLALQNLGEIWINEKSFAEMRQDQDRALLILHELLMGVVLMRYQDALDQCLSAIAVHEVIEVPGQSYRQLRASCHETHARNAPVDIRAIGRRIRLTEDDYLNLRDITLQIWESRGHVNGSELQAWMRIKGFRAY